MKWLPQFLLTIPFLALLLFRPPTLQHDIYSNWQSILLSSQSIPHLSPSLLQQNCLSNIIIKLQHHITSSDLEPMLVSNKTLTILCNSVEQLLDLPRHPNLHYRLKTDDGSRLQQLPPDMDVIIDMKGEAYSKLNLTFLEHVSTRNGRVLFRIMNHKMSSEADTHQTTLFQDEQHHSEDLTQQDAVQESTTYEIIDPSQEGYTGRNQSIEEQQHIDTQIDEQQQTAQIQPQENPEQQIQPYDILNDNQTQPNSQTTTGKQILPVEHVIEQEEQQDQVQPTVGQTEQTNIVQHIDEQNNTNSLHRSQILQKGVEEAQQEEAGVDYEQQQDDEQQQTINHEIDESEHDHRSQENSIKEQTYKVSPTQPERQHKQDQDQSESEYEYVEVEVSQSEEESAETPETNTTTQKQIPEQQQKTVQDQEQEIEYQEVEQIEYVEVEEEEEEEEEEEQPTQSPLQRGPPLSDTASNTTIF